jgi:hypothetical protein
MKKPGASDIRSAKVVTRTFAKGASSTDPAHRLGSSSDSDRFGPIQVRGARDNNLKNISVDIPRRQITV